MDYSFVVNELRVKGLITANYNYSKFASNFPTVCKMHFASKIMVYIYQVFFQHQDELFLRSKFSHLVAPVTNSLILTQLTDGTR